MATKFVRRTTAPSSTNKYYIKTTKGGYNRCIQIKADGSVLPNCVGYAWGRYCEEQNIHNCNLSRGNAENWYPNTQDGYDRGKTPKLGAVICWHSTRSGGHVAIVEKINKNGTILTSNSAYNGSRFYTKTLNPNNNYYMGSAYTFQGFIYPDKDFVDPDTPIPPPPPIPQDKNKKHKFKWVIYTKKFRNRQLTQ